MTVSGFTRKTRAISGGVYVGGIILHPAHADGEAAGYNPYAGIRRPTAADPVEPRPADCEQEADTVDLISKEMIAKPRASQTAAADPPNTITSLGNRNYAINGKTQHVTPVEDAVLTAVLEADGHVDSDGLIRKSGHGSACKIIRGLRRKYGGHLAPAITLPGRKGKGGYVVRIRRRTIDDG